MSRFGRLKGRSDFRTANTDVASGLAAFLVRATETGALRQAIDACMLALRQAQADDTAAERVSGGSGVATNEPTTIRSTSSVVTVVSRFGSNAEE